jgi:large subunit ribosomal protein L21
MYAIIKTGGKQYRVENGLKLKIEQIPADIGSEVVIDQVLLISDGDNISMGKPVLSGASVTATVLKQGRHDKIRIF